MPPFVAMIVFVAGVAVFFYLDSRSQTPTSQATWITVVWLTLAGSRAVSQWLQLGTPLYTSDLAPEGSPLDRMVYAGLLVSGLLVLARRAQRVGKLLSANLPIILGFGYCAVSLLWSDFPDVAFKRWTKAVGDLVMVLVVVSDRDPRSAMRDVLARASFLLIPFSVLLVKYFPDLGRVYGRWDWKTYYTGVTTDKNTLGVICLFCGLASLWRFLGALRSKEKKRWRELVPHGMIVLMVLWLFWIANSMTSLACFLLASSVLLATHLNSVRGQPAVVNMLVGSSICLCISILFLGLGPGVLESMGRNSTLTDRTGIWSLTLSLTESQLLGTGFESFWMGPRLQTMWSAYSWHPGEAHRTVLNSLLRKQPTGELVLTFFVAGIIYNFTEAAFFRMMAPAWIFFLLAITRIPEPSLSRSLSAVKKDSGSSALSAKRHEVTCPDGAVCFRNATATCSSESPAQGKTDRELLSPQW